MKLADKMFSRETKTCPIRSDCRERTDRAYFDSLFDRDWEVFVIRRDDVSAKYNWFTACCEAAARYSDLCSNNVRN